jgi:hypothetical protein
VSFDRSGGIKMLKEKHVAVSVFDNGIEFAITDSNGFGLEELKDMESLWERDGAFDEFSWVDLVVKPSYQPAQIGNYPPPNIEIPEHWEYEVISEEKTKVSINGEIVEVDDLFPF